MKQKVKSIALITLFVALAALIVSVIALRYSMQGTSSGHQATANYAVGQSLATADWHPVRGRMNVGMNQTLGPTGTRYEVRWKPSTSSNFALAGTITIQSNNRHHGALFAGTSNGTTRYNFRLSKLNNTNTSTRIIADFFIS